MLFFVEYSFLNYRAFRLILGTNLNRKLTSIFSAFIWGKNGCFLLDLWIISIYDQVTGFCTGRREVAFRPMAFNLILQYARRCCVSTINYKFISSLFHRLHLISVWLAVCLALSVCPCIYPIFVCVCISLSFYSAFFCLWVPSARQAHQIVCLSVCLLCLSDYPFFFLP